jgi:hypothetical protein
LTRAKATAKYFPAIVLASAMAFFAWDIITDILEDGDSPLHITIELLVFAAISLVLFRELRHVKSLNKEIKAEKSKTARLAGELFSVIQSEFSSMKEIADARQVKEKTVRLQATSIYAKSGYAGRHELAAHFIEDLMSEL